MTCRTLEKSDKDECWVRLYGVSGLGLCVQSEARVSDFVLDRLESVLNVLGFTTAGLN